MSGRRRRPAAGRQDSQPAAEESAGRQDSQPAAEESAGRAASGPGAGPGPAPDPGVAPVPRAQAISGAAARGKAVYFFFYAAGAALAPVLTLYYRSVGLSGGEVGMLASLMPAGMVAGAATWAAVADATGRHRRVMMLTIAGAVVVAQLFRLGAGFWSLLPVALVFAFTTSPIMPIADNAVLEALGADRARYGTVRLWGAVGWGITAPLVGLLIDRSSLAVVFPVYGALMLLTLVASARLPVSGMQGGVDVKAGLRMMARDRRWLPFLLIVLVCGAGGGFSHHYLFIYMDEIGSTGLMRGVALAVSTVSELVIFSLADRFVRRFGARRLMLLALAATAVRLLLYSMISVPHLVLLPQLLHGLTFSLFLVAGVTYAQELAAPGMGATAQSVFTSTHMGLGGIVGAMLGGLLYEALGVRRMYFVASLIAIAGTVLFLRILNDRRTPEARAGTTPAGRTPPRSRPPGRS